MSNIKENHLANLKGQYKALSEVQELFPKNSKHKAYLFIDKRIFELLKEISKLENQL